MSFDEACAALDSALNFGIHPSLEGIRAICEALGRPQDTMVFVQVTGTNGKSSVTRMISALLREEGARVGCYTSPHLDEYTERVEIAGEPVSRDSFARGIAAALDAASEAGVAEPTEFELLTAAALWLFRDAALDYAVLEVGMGGRWDATSVVDPAVAVITGVALDHTAHLGDTREAIAADKSMIIKPASAPILGPGTVGVEDVFTRRAEELDVHARAVREIGHATPADEALTVRFGIESRAPGILRIRLDGVHGSYGPIELPAPSYQAANAATAVGAAEAALGRELDAHAVRRALREFRVPARFEVISRQPLAIADGSHNPQAAAMLAEAIESELPGIRPVILLGVLSDKDALGIVEALAPVAGEWAVCAPDSPRALPARELAHIVRGVSRVEPVVYESVEVGVRALLESGGRAVVVTGSLTTAAQARRAVGVSL